MESKIVELARGILAGDMAGDDDAEALARAVIAMADEQKVSDEFVSKLPCNYGNRNDCKPWCVPCRARDRLRRSAEGGK